MSAVKKILLLEFSRIGDTLMHEPTLRALKLRYPKAEIHAYTDNANFDLVAYHPAITKAEVFNRKIKSLKDVPRVFKLIKAIRKEKYDLLVNFYMGGITINLTRFSGIPKRLAFDRYPSLRRVNNLLAHAPSSFGNWIIQFTELLRPLGIDPQSIWPEPRLFLAEDFHEAPNEFLSAGKTYVAYNLATSDPLKCWPVSNYVALAQSLYQKYGFIPVVISNPGQTNLVEEFKSLYPKDLPIIILPVMRLMKLTAILNAMKLIITGDTGIMHMGFALGVPTLAIFTNGRPEFAVSPMTHKVVVFEESTTLPAYPSGQLHGRADLSVELVSNGVEQLLKIIA